MALGRSVVREFVPCSSESGDTSEILEAQVSEIRSFEMGTVVGFRKDKESLNRFCDSDRVKVFDGIAFDDRKGMGVEGLMYCRDVGPDEVTVNVEPSEKGVVYNRVGRLISKPISNRVVLARDVFPTDFLV